MRKILLIFMMLILAVILGWIVWDGFKIGNFEIYSYKGIGEKSKDLNDLIGEYNSKNPDELLNKQSELVKTVEEYENQKGQYEQLLEAKKNDLLLSETANCYDVDYLWTKVGNYATDRGLDLEMDVSKSSADQNKSEYILADLSFTLMGNYEDIDFFINDIEDDPKLEFEIRDFIMKKDKIKKEGTDIEVLKATFKVYGIAINKSTLTNLTQSNPEENKENVANSTGVNF